MVFKWCVVLAALSGPALADEQVQAANSAASSSAGAQKHVEQSGSSDELQQLKEQQRRLQERLQQLEQEVANTSAPPQVQAANQYNPAIGLILNGRWLSTSLEPVPDHFSGFPLPEETGIGEPGLLLGESELNLTGNVDDKFYASATIAFSDEGATVEEAYLETLEMPWDMTVKFGRFLSSVGYLNGRHSHTDDFATRPLVYDAFFGGGYGDDGVSVQWLAPTDVFWETGIELLRGGAFPAAGAANSGNGALTAHSHWGGDLGDSHSWRAGVSWMSVKADQRTDATGSTLFDGDSTLWGVDFVWKWAPHGNPTTINAKVQGEWFRRREKGFFAQGANVLQDSLEQSGGYLQAVYQFRRQWRTGVRYDWLKGDRPATVLQGSYWDTLGHGPERWSWMLDWSNSEFSRLRLQYSRDRSDLRSGDVWTVQYIAAFGAHPAHSF